MGISGESKCIATLTIMYSFVTIDITSVLLLNIVSQEFLRNKNEIK